MFSRFETFLSSWIEKRFFFLHKSSQICCRSFALRFICFRFERWGDLNAHQFFMTPVSVQAVLCVILKSFLVLSASMPTTKASKMCRGWTTEVHWQPGDSPKWFYCKRLTDGHTSYFPRTCCSRRSAEKILVVGTRPRSPAGATGGWE